MPGRDQGEPATLFVAATRPAMVLGLSLPCFALFLMLFCLVMVIGEDPLYEIALAPVWFGLRLALRYDYNMPRILMLFCKTKLRSPETAWFGGASPASFPLRVHKRAARGIADAR